MEGKKYGKVWITGAGCGDKGLLTLRAAAVISRADCIVYDSLVGEGVLEFANEDCEKIFVGKRKGNHAAEQDEINEILLEAAGIYKCIVRLKGGDGYVFGRGGEEAAFLSDAGVPFEVIPGISSSVGGLAYAGIPVTHRKLARGFHVWTAHDLDGNCEVDFSFAANTRETLIFLMGMSKLKEIVTELLEHGKPADTPAAVASSLSLPSQRVVTGRLDQICSLAEKNRLTSPAVIVVGETVTLREKLDFFEKKSLFGKRIVIAGPKGAYDEMREGLENLGAEAYEVRTGNMVYYSSALKEVDWKKYQWLVFTSRHAVRSMQEFFQMYRVDLRVLAGLKIACVGKKTAEELARIQIYPDYIAQMQDAKSLAEGLCQKLDHENDHVLYLSGAAYSQKLLQQLREASAEIRRISVYENLLVLYDGKLAEKKINDAIEKFECADAIIFTCSSAVDCCIPLLKECEKEGKKIPMLITIGKKTAQSLEQEGYTAIQSDGADYEGCIHKLTEVQT